MTKFTEQINIQTSIEQIWQVLADLGEVCKFAPGVSHSYYVGSKNEGVGAARICELSPMGKVKETVTTWVENRGFNLQIEAIEKMPPIKNIEVILRLDDSHPKTTKVKIEVQYDTKLGVIGQLLNTIMIKSQMVKGIKGTLDGLKIYLEEGREIKDFKSLKQVA